MSAQRLHGLDTLRGIAALIVVIYHAEIAVGGQRLFAHGYMAVDFFFALSGFVMARTYEGRFPAPLAFGAARMRRFAAVMACGSALGFFALLPEHGLAAAAIFAVLSLLYIPSLTSTEALFPANPPQWSILFEILANVLHAGLLHRLRAGWILLLALLCAAAMIAFATKLDDFAFVLPRTLMSYCLGILLFRWEAFLPRLPYLLAPLLLVGGIALADVAPVFVWLFVLVAAPTCIVCGLGGNRAIPWLGAISFPLYAVHYQVLMICAWFGLPKVLGVIAAVAVAALVTALFERHGAVRARPQPVSASS